MVGFGEAKPPQDSHFVALRGGKAPAQGHKERFSEGLRPSKPPLEDRKEGNELSK